MSQEASGYAVALGVVWVAFAFFAGIMLVMSRQNELVREALSAATGQQKVESRAQAELPPPKSNTTAKTSVTIEGTTGDDVVASVKVAPKQ